jgi:hypothetical protein
MPSWEAALDDDQIQELIHYVRHFCDGQRLLSSNRGERLQPESVMAQRLAP